MIMFATISFHNFEYFIVLILCLFFPLLFSLFHPNSPLKGIWNEVLTSIFSVAFFWIIADIIQTYRGHWSFNSDYTLGFKIINLPIEEVFFFLVVPFCCTFIWLILRDFTTWKKFFDNFFDRFIKF